jgi:DUF1009 family protein
MMSESVKGAGISSFSVADLRSPVGLIAGNGTFPREFARRARAAGLNVVALAHRGETDPALADEVDTCLWVRVGQLGKIIRQLRVHGVRQVALAGGISRVRLFGGVRLDWRGAALVARLRSVRDDVVLRGIAAELERSGLTVFSAALLLDKGLAPEGTLTRRQLPDDRVADARIGWEAAKAIGALDIGQTVVVADGLVVAVEAVEGTDRAIARAHELGGRNLVVVKVCKPHQDERLDLPTIGRGTIERCTAAGVVALVIEAGRTIILEPDEVVRAADAAGIAIVAVSGPPALTP